VVLSASSLHGVGQLCRRLLILAVGGHERRGSAAAERIDAVRWNRLLGASAPFKLPADVYGQDLVLCIPLFCVIRSQIQIWLSVPNLDP